MVGHWWVVGGFGGLVTCKFDKEMTVRWKWRWWCPTEWFDDFMACLIPHGFFRFVCETVCFLAKWCADLVACSWLRMVFLGVTIPTTNRFLKEKSCILANIIFSVYTNQQTSISVPCRGAPFNTCSKRKFNASQSSRWEQLLMYGGDGIEKVANDWCCVCVNPTAVTLCEPSMINGFLGNRKFGNQPGPAGALSFSTGSTYINSSNLRVAWHPVFAFTTWHGYGKNCDPKSFQPSHGTKHHGLWVVTWRCWFLQQIASREKRLCVNEMIVKTPKKRLVSWDKQKTFYPLKSSRPGWTSKVISVPYNGSGRIEWVSKYPDHRYPNPKKPVGSRLCTCASYTSPITIPLSCTLSLYKYLYLYL